MKFSTFLEVFDNPYKIEVIKKDKFYRFITSSGVTVDFVIDEYWDEDIDNYYLELIFDADGEWDLTGEGDAFRIFATLKKIIDIIASSLRGSEIGYITFAAKSSEKGRVKFYRTVQKYIKKATEYKYSEIVKRDGDWSYLLFDNPKGII